MGSLHRKEETKRNPTWVYPKPDGPPPPARWGHSACFADGIIYIFGGCSSGLHFQELLKLNLKTMAWSSIPTTGDKPDRKDSHTAAIFHHKMFIFGGTNGMKKSNDLHALDLSTGEWSKPVCSGSPPCPRESHTATIVGEDKLVIFGGSGDRERKYLNDVHVLDLKNMSWISPPVKGYLPAARDSHIAVTAGNKLVIYGGDCGDRYHGGVDVLDLATFTWFRPAIDGTSPGARAGHAAVNLGSKVCIIGGVGDKRYYSDVWVLDTRSFKWAQIEVGGRRPQGRFSHTAIVAGSEVAVFGGCGEDERPLSELLILRHRGRYLSEEREGLRFISPLGTSSCSADDGDLRKKETAYPKRRKPEDRKPWEDESEQEDNSLSLSTQSSPSQSDQDNHNPQNITPSFHWSPPTNPPIGAEVRGVVDGAFDSGYLMTAKVNGVVLRGVLFAPGHKTRSIPQPAFFSFSDSGRDLRRQRSPEFAAGDHGQDLQGVVLSLGGPVLE